MTQRSSKTFDPFGEHSSSVNSLTQQKNALRSLIRAERRSRRAAEDAESRVNEASAFTASALAEPVIARARCVATFEPMRTEPDLTHLNTTLEARGVRLLVPITLDNLELSWRDQTSGSDLGRGGIAEADVIIAPGLAVDVRGYRLGQGGGCYDGSLPRRRTGTPVIMAAFDSEVLDDPVPTEPHDLPVDAVLTPSGVRWFTR